MAQHRAPDDRATARRILDMYETIAVVGLSRHPYKSAHSVPASLQAAGFNVIPVNPNATNLLGEKSYPQLEDVTESVEVVEVFRPSAEAPGIARDAVRIGAKAQWLQTGLRSLEARAIAEDGGLLYVEDRCMAVDRAVFGITKSP
jgi:predicted CoA-binding protein